MRIGVLALLLAGTMSVSGCIGAAAVAAASALALTQDGSDVTEGWTDAQYNKCMKSLTQRDIDRVARAATKYSVIPLANLTGEQRKWEAIRDICAKRGIVPAG